MSSRTRSRSSRILKKVVLAALVLFVVGVGGAGLSFAYIKSQVPSIRSAADYNPPQSTKVYSDDGQLVAELFKERRTVVPIASIPKHVSNAFLAAEDANFYQHEGLDYWGIARAALKNLRPGAHLQGASTITQQTVKTLIVGAERSVTRKLKEAILAREMEQLLTKDEILYLYLNQIYFGSGAYGVEEAARTYFGKSVRDLDLGEAALMASIPKNPSHYTPAADPIAAKQRQKYVLEQMQDHGWATPEDVQAALKKPVQKPPPGPQYLGAGPHYVEHVKKTIIEEMGISEEQLLTGGYTLYLGMNAKMQSAAHLAIKNGLEAFTKTRGFAGPKLRIEVDKLTHTKKLLHEAFDKKIDKLGKFDGMRTDDLIWDLSGLSQGALSDDKLIGTAVRTAPMAYGQRVAGLVTDVDSVGDVVWVDVGPTKARIRFASMAWAKKPNGPMPKDPSEVVRPGDVVLIDLVDVPEVRTKKSVLGAELVPEPKVEGALVAIDPHTRMVRAVVGGYRAEMGGFNRAVQAHRQPGSTFKPLLYAAGIAQNAITAATTCPDSPVVIRDPWTGKPWKPENYEDGRFDGNITYRTALMRSKNTCSVKLIEKVSPEQVITFAKSAGIESQMPSNLTLALGTGDVTVLELTNAYSTIASGGYVSKPIFIRKVVDRTGQVIVENAAAPTEAIKPAVAFVITQMMRSVIEEGTATKALVLDRPLAGKTGTSQESRNVWFAGFSPELVASVWVGYDDNSPLSGATGGAVALPIWVNFMGRALYGTPVSEFTAPSDVVFVRVDADSGLPTDDVGSIEEAFVIGTEPSKETQALPSIFIEDN